MFMQPLEQVYDLRISIRGPHEILMFLLQMHGCAPLFDVAVTGAVVNCTAARHYLLPRLDVPRAPREVPRELAGRPASL